MARLRRPAFITVLIALVAVMAGFLVSPARGVTAPITLLESDLNPDGGAYEINPGPDGTLWLSDNLAGEIRAYAPDGSSVTIYGDLGRVSDARAGSGSTVWYVDQASRQLGKLDTATETVTFWPLPAGGPSGFGTAFDAQGRLWISDFGQPLLARFTPDAGMMCAFDIAPLASGGSPYLAFDGQTLWLSDFYHNAVLGFNPQTGRLTRWSLDPAIWDFEAEGLAADGAGGLWFTTASTRALGRLDLTTPGAPGLLRYAIPTGGGQPATLATAGSQLWYTGYLPATLGRLSPGAVTPTAYTPQVAEATIAATCSTPAATTPAAVTVTHESPVWTPVAYNMDDTGAWALIALDTDAFPWGIALQSGDLWAADTGQQVLMRLLLSADGDDGNHQLYLPSLRR